MSVRYSLMELRLNWCDSFRWRSNPIPTDKANRAILGNMAGNMAEQPAQIWVYRLPMLCLLVCLLCLIVCLWCSPSRGARHSWWSGGDEGALHPLAPRRGRGPLATWVIFVVIITSLIVISADTKTQLLIKMKNTTRATSPSGLTVWHGLPNPIMVFTNERTCSLSLSCMFFHWSRPQWGLSIHAFLRGCVMVPYFKD